MLIRKCLDYNVDETYNANTGETTLRISSESLAYRDEDGELAPINLLFKEDSKSIYCDENNLSIKIYKDSDVDLSIKSEGGLSADITFLPLRLRDCSKDIEFHNRVNSVYDNFVFSSTRDGYSVLLSKNRICEFFMDEYLLVPSGYKHSLYIDEGFKGCVPNGCLLEIPYRYVFNEDVSIETWSGIKTISFETPTSISIRSVYNDNEKIEIYEPLFFDIDKKGNLPIWYKVEFKSPCEFIFSYVIETSSLFNTNLKYPLVIDPTRELQRTTWKQTTNEVLDFTFPFDQRVVYWMGARGYNTAYSSTTSEATLWDGSANGSYTNSNRRHFVRSTDHKNEELDSGYLDCKGNDDYKSRIRAYQSNRDGIGNSALVEINIRFSTSAIGSNRDLSVYSGGKWSSITTPRLYVYSGGKWRLRYFYEPDDIQPFIDD